MDQFIEILGILSGLLYVYLEIKQKNFMWVVCFISALAYTIIFAKQQLFAAMIIQVYYLAMSFYGFYKWQTDKKKTTTTNTEEKQTNNTIVYRNPSIKTIILSIILMAVVFISLLTILKQFTKDPMPATDAFTTAVSVIATFWLSKLYRAQWLMWVLVNVFTIILCISTGLYASSILYIIYTISAIYGYIHWQKKGILLT